MVPEQRPSQPSAALAANVGVNVNGQFGTFKIGNSDGTYSYTLDELGNAAVNAPAE